MKTNPSENTEEKNSNTQEFFFPDIDGVAVSVKAENMKEAEEKARVKVKKTKK